MRHARPITATACAVVFLGIVLGTTARPQLTVEHFEKGVRRSALLDHFRTDSALALARAELRGPGHAPALGLHAAGGHAHEYYRPDADQYGQAALSFSVPITGAPLRAKDDRDRLGMEALRVGAERQQAACNLLAEARREYYRYWNAQRKIAMSELFLSSEAHVDRILRLRTGKAYLLESDRRELMMMCELARKNISVFGLSLRVARRRLRELCGETVAEFTAVTPCLPPVPPRPVTGDSVRTPLLDHLRSATDQGRRRGDALRNIETSVGVVGRYDYRRQDGDGGDVHAYAAVNVPLTVGNLVREQQRADELEGERLRNERVELEATAARLLHDAHDRLETARMLLDYGVKRLQGAEELVRVALLRATLAEGDMIEQFLKARYEYYKASVDLLDAEEELLAAAAEVARYGCSGVYPDDSTGVCGDSLPDRPAVKSALVGLTVLSDLQDVGDFDVIRSRINRVLPASRVTAPPEETAPASGKGVLVWKSGRALAEPEDFARRMSAGGFQRVAVSFSAQQLAALSQSSSEREKLSNLLALLARRGIEAELLLGEPTWMMPANRAKLIAVIHQLSVHPFLRVVLDLEPNQLDPQGLRGDTVVCWLTQTLAEVCENSPLPVDLCIHPRYVQAPCGATSLGDRLREIGVGGVRVMIYSSSERTIADRVRSLAAAYPTVRFGVVVTVEPTSVLKPEESLAGKGRKGLNEAIGRLAQDCSGIEGFGGIDVQSWEYLEGMGP